ncbi:BspA family leucine-rich repeat surface protein [Candidatus Lokiarchaeum ossiferum]|uniref:BspA family leucine-rich repeat surface protein n=1 Tax=Candidatus Lokiarchaeum ossiferum TaxID=2951803 RepID=UPI00352EE688
MKFKNVKIILTILFISVLCTTTYTSKSSIESIFVQNSNELIIHSSTDSTAFISRWQTNLTSSGSSNTTQVRLPIYNGGTYDFIVDWGDGTMSEIKSWNSVNQTHNYNVPGIYTIIITGNINGWRFDTNFDLLKIIEIQQWGCLNLGNLGNYFSGCKNLILSNTDAINLTNTTNLSYMFSDCTSISTGNSLFNWNMSDVVNMSHMFSYATYFNQNIGGWNVSHVIDMSHMFHYANYFNQNIGGWDVSKVTNMSHMFMANRYIANEIFFNQDIGDWDVSEVTDMSYMFNGVSSFNQDIGGWNVSEVTDMSYMFDHAHYFNHDIGGWDVSKVTDMSGMFLQVIVFNQDIGAWNVSNVRSMKNMFYDNYQFNKNIGAWNVSKVTNMGNMFAGASVFNQNIGGWNVSCVTNMRSMFYGANSFNQPIGNWDVSRVSNMQGMFDRAYGFNQPIGNWDVSHVTNMVFMFQNASIFDQDIGSWKVELVEDLHNFLYGVKLSTNNYDNLLIKWSQLSLKHGIRLNAGYSQYSNNASSAHEKLTKTFGWTIYDGGYFTSLENPPSFPISTFPTTSNSSSTSTSTSNIPKSPANPLVNRIPNYKFFVLLIFLSMVGILLITISIPKIKFLLQEKRKKLPWLFHDNGNNLRLELESRELSPQIVKIHSLIQLKQFDQAHELYQKTISKFDPTENEAIFDIFRPVFQKLQFNQNSLEKITRIRKNLDHRQFSISLQNLEAIFLEIQSCDPYFLHLAPIQQELQCLQENIDQIFMKDRLEYLSQIDQLTESSQDSSSQHQFQKLEEHKKTLTIWKFDNLFDKLDEQNVLFSKQSFVQKMEHIRQLKRNDSIFIAHLDIKEMLIDINRWAKTFFQNSLLYYELKNLHCELDGIKINRYNEISNQIESTSNLILTQQFDELDHFFEKISQSLKIWPFSDLKEKVEKQIKVFRDLQTTFNFQEGNSIHEYVDDLDVVFKKWDSNEKQNHGKKI